MRYLLQKELSVETLLLSTETKEAVTGDKVFFAIPPREGLRLEIQKELKELIKQEELITDPNLIKYSNLEKLENEMVLIRKPGLKKGIVEFKPKDLAETGQVLLMVLKVMAVYHEQEVLLGGLTLGQLKRGVKGEAWLQDPPVMNHLSKSLNKLYQNSMPPEIMRGKAWSSKTDIFSWGELAYRLFTGVDPYASESSADRAAKIIRAVVQPLRDYHPELSQEMNNLIMSCLEPLPDQRPDLAYVIEELSKMLTDGSWQAPLIEAADYAAKVETNKSRFEIREKMWLWFRKFGWLTFGVVSVSLVIILLVVGTKAKGVLTSKTTPQQVLSYYFKAIEDIDVVLLDETVTSTKNSFDEVVANIHVINVTQQGMTNSRQGNIHLKINNRKITTLAKTTAQVNYRIAYTLKMLFPDKAQYIERVDDFELKPVRKIWRITKIKILHEKNWEEKLTPTPPPVPLKK